MGGENGFTRKEGFDGPEGTVWNALVTSDADIREGGATGPGKGGVPPSSDFTSWIEKGTVERSSAMPFNELTVGRPSLSGVCDQTALRCSGSTLAGDLTQAADEL